MVDQRLRTFGQNMDVCLSLLNRSHEDLSKGAGITVSKLKQLHTGEVSLSIAQLQAIADELNLPPFKLTQTHPSSDRVERMRRALEETGCIDSDSTLTALPIMPRLEPKLPPTIRRTSATQLMVTGETKPRAPTPPPAPIVVVPAPETAPAQRPMIPDLLAESIKLTGPTPSPSKIKPTRKERRISTPKQQVVEAIDPAFVMSFDGVDYNLRDKTLKKALVDRIRFLKGRQTYIELAARLPKKRSYAWLISLGGITPEEVVSIAELCATTPKSLVTGEGIVSLAAKESAEEWLLRYIEQTKDGNALKDAALEIKRNLKVWPAPLRHMIVRYLLEIA